jgi:hypothetical protein
MNMNNKLLIKTIVLSKLLDTSIIAINMKHYNRLSSKSMHTQINIFNMQDMIRELSVYVTC